MFNILYKFNVIWMRNKERGKILRQDPFTFSKGKIFKSKQNREWGAKKKKKTNSEQSPESKGILNLIY